MTKKISRIFDRALDIMAIVAGVLLMFATLSVFFSVIVRSIGYPWGWVPEIGSYILLFCCFLLAAWALREEKHVIMELVVNRVKPKVRFTLDIITSILSAIVCLVLTWYGAKVTIDLYQTHYFTTTLLELPKFSLNIVIPIGFFILFIQLIRRTRSKLISFKELSDRGNGPG